MLVEQMYKTLSFGWVWMCVLTENIYLQALKLISSKYSTLNGARSFAVTAKSVVQSSWHLEWRYLYKGQPSYFDVRIFFPSKDDSMAAVRFKTVPAVVYFLRANRLIVLQRLITTVRRKSSMFPTCLVNQRFVVHPWYWWTRWRKNLRYWLTQRDNNNNLLLIYFNIFIAQLTIIVLQITMQYSNLEVLIKYWHLLVLKCHIQYIDTSSHSYTYSIQFFSSHSYANFTFTKRSVSQ